MKQWNTLLGNLIGAVFVFHINAASGEGQYFFPLKAGNQWTYKFEFGDKSSSSPCRSTFGYRKLKVQEVTYTGDTAYFVISVIDSVLWNKDYPSFCNDSSSRSPYSFIVKKSNEDSISVVNDLYPQKMTTALIRSYLNSDSNTFDCALYDNKPHTCFDERYGFERYLSIKNVGLFSYSEEFLFAPKIYESYELIEYMNADSMGANINAKNSPQRILDNKLFPKERRFNVLGQNKRHSNYGFKDLHSD